jgi:hypothetical protein
MVAMRVVNSVEREMLKAEWENWLLDENTRCKQAEMILKKNRGNIPPSRRFKGVDSQQVLEAKEQDKIDKLDSFKNWQEEYCGSCKVEQERLLDGQKHIAFG